VNRVLEERNRVKHEIHAKELHKHTTSPIKSEEPVSPKAVTAEKSKKLTLDSNKQSPLQNRTRIQSKGSYSPIGERDQYAGLASQSVD